MEETRSARDFFDDEEYAFLEETARAPEGSWAYGSDMQGITSQMAAHVLAGEMTEFELVLERDEATTSQCCAVEEFRRLVLLGLAYGVEVEDAPCANYLGALYYMGELVPQDYRRAKELYALADSKGLVQGMINLGYIYEYGRVGEPDYPKAYAQYAKAVAIANHPEALYKLGDMYARGQAVEKDLHKALVLWDRSLKEAKGEAMQAQPAFRIAQLIADPASAQQDLPYDPMGALRLFQLAERGLMIAISKGDTYYRSRLAKAIEGQERMRAVLQSPEGCQYLE